MFHKTAQPSGQSLIGILSPDRSASREYEKKLFLSEKSFSAARKEEERTFRSENFSNSEHGKKLLSDSPLFFVSSDEARTTRTPADHVLLSCARIVQQKHVTPKASNLHFGLGCLAFPRLSLVSLGYCRKTLISRHEFGDRSAHDLSFGCFGSRSKHNE